MRALLTKDGRGLAVPDAEGVLLDRLKAIPGRHWSSRDRAWVVPLNCGAVLERWGLQIDERWHRLAARPTSESLRRKLEQLPLPEPLLPYQVEGVANLHHMKGRALLADEPGLGKTLQAITWMRTYPGALPAVVVSPAHLRGEWRKQMWKWWRDVRPVVVDGAKAPLPKDAEVVLISYNLVSKHLRALQALRPKTLILDEAHYVKNPKAGRSSAVEELVSYANHRICITGTPALSETQELFPLLELIAPGQFGSWYYFGRRYFSLRRGRFGWEPGAATHSRELHRRLKYHMIRRHKADVLPQLPPKQTIVVPVELTDRRSYNAAERELLRLVAEQRGKLKDDSPAAVQLGAMLRETALLKLPSVISWIERFLRNDRKLVVFARHHHVLDQLSAHFAGRVVAADGRSSAAEKRRAEMLFQRDTRIRLAVLGLEAMNSGINLTASTDVALVELPWVPGVIDQASDRVHRVTTRGEVTVWYLLAEDTVEEDVVDVNDAKRAETSAVVDGRKKTEVELLRPALSKAATKRRAVLLPALLEL